MADGGILEAGALLFGLRGRGKVGIADQVWMGADEREFFVGTCLTDGGHECAVKTFARSEGASGSGAGGDPG